VFGSLIRVEVDGSEEVSKMTFPSGPSHHTFGEGSPLGLSQKISTVPFSGTANLWLGIKGVGSRDVLMLSGSMSTTREKTYVI